MRAHIPIGTAWPLLCVLIVSSCGLRNARIYRVIPQAPVYLLESPNSQTTPFSDVLRRYNGFERGRASIDLRPQMEIRIENAYYEKGASRKGLKGFLGTEVARYEITAAGLRLLSVLPMAGRPEGDVPVEHLISSAQMKFHYYRLYFEILFDRKKDEHGSVLLAADSIDELNRLSAQLSDPETVCGRDSTQCKAFPEACSVSVEMNIVVNGKSQSANWGSLLSSVVTHPPQYLEMQRFDGRRLAKVKIDPHDPIALGLPLVPGDHISWH